MSVRRWGLVVLAFLLSACAPMVATPETESPIGRITFAGSTTVQPLAHELGQAFRALYPEVELDIAAGGSVVGIQAVHNGTVDIGMASRVLRPEEEEGIDRHQIAVDVLAVVVHASNPVENVTREQLQAIYHGQITNWSEVGGLDLAIMVVARSSTSGTRGAFDDIVLEGEAPLAPDLHEAITAGDMAAVVAANAGAIGYVGFGNLEPNLKMVSIDGVLPSEAAARDGSYPLVRPLLLLTGPLTQPLGQMFVDYALSDAGQQVVRESGWVPAR